MASFARARGGKTQEFFDIERQQVGRRSVDLNLSQEISRTLDQDIDSIFPAWKTVADKKTAKQSRAMKAPALDYKLSTPPGRATSTHIPSRDTGGNATLAPAKVYTGTKVKGIATMHKSNAVPVFSDEEAVEISNMRR